MRRKVGITARTTFPRLPFESGVFNITGSISLILLSDQTFRICPSSRRSVKSESEVGGHSEAVSFHCFLPDLGGSPSAFTAAAGMMITCPS